MLQSGGKVAVFLLLYVFINSTLQNDKCLCSMSYTMYVYVILTLDSLNICELLAPAGQKSFRRYRLPVPESFEHTINVYEIVHVCMLINGCLATKIFTSKFSNAEV